MLKDPLHQEETPYELLALHPNARPDELHHALPNFMRRPENIPRLGEGMQAVQRLKDPRSRLSVDLMHYQLDGLKLAEKTEPPPLNLDNFFKVPCFPPEQLFTDLDLEDFDADLEDLVCQNFSPQPDNRYNRLADYHLEVELDR